MSLSAGSRIGPYEILAPIGAGGMGEVYRAHDAKLGRDVAIKILPDALAGDADRRSRFEREARTLAALNHPHIAQIFGFEDTPPTHVGHAGGGALIMELVDGPTLAQRIAQSGRLPIDDAVAIARQIADALEAAHDQGIIHRDLKPGNIKIRHDGTVKVLDFGLAKALEPSGIGGIADSSAMNSPTQTARATVAGIVLGTAAYMAPEQARGKPVDRRADVWAFGTVLYEMLTGRRAFRGDDTTDILASVLRQEPDWSALPPNVPPAIRRLLRRCLAKNPRARLSAMADARLELDEPASAEVEAEPRARSDRLGWTAVAVLSAVAVIAAIAVAMLLRREPAAVPLSRFSTPPPPGTTLFPDSTAVAISPDGRFVAMVTGDVAAALPPTFTGLWIRALDSIDARPLPGTEGAVFPFWSPDSRQLAFFANRQLKKITLADGHIDEICDAPDPRGGTWSQSNVIVFSPLNSGPLMRVNATGGKPEAVTVLAANEHGHRFPAFLDDGDHFVYASVPPRNGEFDILLGSVSGGLDRTPLLTAQGAPAVAAGHLLFMRRGSLVAQRFDERRRAPAGELVSLPDVPRDVGVYAIGAAAVSASDNGTLAYYTHPAANSKLVWFERSGRQQATVSLPAGTWLDVGLAPNLRRAAVVRQVSPAVTELWIVDLERGGASRLANAPGQNNRPVFSPDSERVAFSSDRDGPRDMYVISAQGNPPEQPLYRSKTLAKDPLSWSPDGRFLVYRDVGPSTGWDLWTRPAAGEGAPAAYAQGPATETNGAISPDGRWMVYASDETGRYEVYVQEFPIPQHKYRVTSNGGARAWWRADGRQLLILNLDWTQLLAADVRPGPSFSSDVPRQVGQLPKGIVAIDVAPDATRLIAVLNDGSDSARTATVVQNWPAALEKR